MLAHVERWLLKFNEADLRRFTEVTEVLTP